MQIYPPYRPLLAALFAGCLAGLSVPAAELRLDEDRLTLIAHGERLPRVMEEFVLAGVSVEMEPGIDAILTGELIGEEINSAMEQLFGKFNYILFWRRIDGPLGPLNQLSGIHLFRPGKHREVVPFLPIDANLVVISLPGVPPHVKDELLLGVKPGTTAKQFKEFLAAIGATAVDSIPRFGIYRIRLPRDSDVPSLAATLGRNPWVVVAEPNYVHEIPSPSRVPASSTEASSPAAARKLDEPVEGSATVAVFDSGLTPMDSLNNAVVGAYDAVDPSRAIADPVGHGTQMALVAAGAVVPHGVPTEAAAASVPVLAVRSFDDYGRASNYSLLRGIDYSIGQGARVISMSWGTETASDFLEDAIRYAQEREMIVVASAGNEPVNRPVYPAAYSGVLGIAALQADGSVWPQSNYGSFVFAAAPGTGDFPVGYNGPPGLYAGTSIASPTVARALTLYLTNHPEASPEEAVEALRKSLTDAGKPGRDEQTGYGVLDAEAFGRFLP